MQTTSEYGPRRRRRRTSVCIPLGLAPLLLAALLAGSPAARGQDPDVTDEAVDAAIRKAVTWILAQRGPEGHWERTKNEQDKHWAGSSALAVLSLLYAGQDPRSEDMDRALTWLAGQTLNGTYAYGTRAHALALVPGSKFTARLKEDLAWLLSAVGSRGTDAVGAYDYVLHPPGQMRRWDNSVTQYGVLGVWAAADAGLSVPESYWESVGEHFVRFQNTDGGWYYEPQSKISTGSMTAAGLGSLFVVLDQCYSDRPREAGAIQTAIRRGLDWLGREYGPENPNGPNNWHYYYLYGVERVGRASGYKYFRNKDWFRDGAAYLLRAQRPDGSWPGGESVRNTAWALMFLCHGRAPLLAAKLEHGADWDGKLRDLAGLTRYCGHAFERLLNWQIVRLDGSVQDLMEAPVLYIYGEGPREFSDFDVQVLREYAERGGLIFVVFGRGGTGRGHKGDDDGSGFRASIESLVQRAFPEHPLRPVRDGHSLVSGEVQFAIDDPPPLLEVHNGVRTLLLLCLRDLAAAWNRYAVQGRREADLQLGANVYLYATDKTTIRSRLQTAAIVKRDVPIERTIELARVRYDGEWNPEPYGWTRFENYMNNEAATRVLVTSGVALDSEDLKAFSVAHMAGRGAFTLRPEELRGLRQFLSSGGTLLADAVGSEREFAQSLEAAVREAMREEPRALPPDSPILTGEGIPGAVSLRGVAYRRAVRSAGRGQEYPRLVSFQGRRRAMVVYSPLDLSVGLLGTQVYNLQGYEPETALRIMRNLVLYAGLPAADKAKLSRTEGS